MKTLWFKLVFLLMVVPNWALAVNYNPKFEFGTLGSSSCVVNSASATGHDHDGDSKNDHDGATVTCTLKFNKTYSGDIPLVFVMPTVDATLSVKSSKTTEYPSTLRVYDVTNAQATISQKIAPHRRASSKINFVPAPMQSIDYFVIEPGVLDLSNGSRIVAGSVDTKTACGKHGGCNKQTIKYTNFGAPDSFGGALSEVPGLLVEPQTINNKRSDGEPHWLTGASETVTKSSFKLFLERSEVGSNAQITKNEKVAFVAGLGQGYVSGLKFWLGSAETLNTTGFTEKVIQPIADGCKIYTGFSVAFDSIPTLIGTKNSRYGADGGWLRRCDVKKDKVAFIVEEDMDDSGNSGVERRHKQEIASFFMFEKPPAQAICQLFPSPVQTWSGNRDSLYIANEGRIKGAPIVGGKRYVGYESGDIDNWKAKGCDGTQCFSDTGLQPPKITLESFRSPDVGYESLTVSGTKTISGDLSIGRTSVEKHGKLIVNSGTYWIDNLNVLGEMIIPSGQNVLIHTKAFSIGNKAYFGIEWDASLKESVDAKLTVFVHDLNFSPLNPTSGAHRDRVDLANNSTFSGLLYSEIDVVLSNNSAINGAVTSKSLAIHNNAYVNATNQCFDPADDYKVTMTPATDLALMCGDDVPVFTINTTNNDEAEGLPITALLTPDASKFNITAEPGFGSGSYPNFISNSSGSLKLKVTPKSAGNVSLSTNYSLSVTMDDDPSQQAQSQFEFVPFKFEVQNQEVIAGKEYDVITKVLACDDSGKTVAESYTGTPVITNKVNKPVSGVDGTLVYEPEFLLADKGSRQDKLSINESGEFLVTLTDSNFDCTGLSDCPIDGSGVLTGSFTIISSPWKIAICDVKAADDSKNNPAKTNEPSGHFISANTDFKATFKPIVHPDFYTTSRDECNYQTTYNYFTEASHTAPFKVSFDLEYPSLGTLGNLASDKFSGDFSFLASDKIATSRQKTMSFSWDDVGALSMKSDADYLSMSLEQDTQVIGRFYPDYFNITQSNWTAPDNQGGSTYMGQPFKSVSFEIKAYNRGGNETKNYGYFTETLKASYYLRGEKSDRVSILDLDLGSDNWVIGRGVWSRSWSDVNWNRIGSSTKTTTPDGPYNSTWAGDATTKTELSLSLDQTGDGSSNHTDPTLFQVTNTDGTTSKVVSQLLLSQPDVRYGRMRLQDVGGNQGHSISVPLSIEYWRSGNFALNTKDSNSRFDTSGNMQCNHIEWSESKPAVSDASLFSDPTDTSVNNGVSEFVLAKQITSRREQVRLFLRQGGTADPDGTTCSWSTGNQPWLIYNWRSKGDEDPSAVVTFGINRGNDRIIFRGEGGLIGQ